MKKALVIFLALAAALGGVWQFSRQESGPSDLLELHGNVDIRQVALAFDGSGRITELRAEEGDRVTEGQVIGVLDTRTLALQADQAAALVEASRQSLLRLQNGARPEEIAQVRAQLASAEATAARAAQDLTRAQRLQSSSSGAVSVQAVDHAQSEAEAAEAKVTEIRAALDLAEAGARKEDIAAAEADLAAARANLALLRHQIDLGTLRAPIASVVRSRLLEPGDQATPQLPVFALAVTEPKWVRVYVSEPDLGRIAPGLHAEVVSDSAPDQPLPGTVGYISSVAEFTPKPVQTEELRTSLVYETRITVTDPQDQLRLGQPVTVRIPLGTAPGSGQ
ncbi:HlyD family efflux transporter periplasmic adaptor subunit [Salipiger mangrovisoli]|uniref:HlyD family efflux transporter periplasmic adaptor subunit n=1 Tax=Salipiger mangrovisoli TaxID=2865933 RepID=A0ABR9WZX5_9RHOB|nr:HlyD family efflux transporter periplasmic adaptor subunit [Salipiger mangrovisoli]MBE9636849.1 HlyD family efflux transporter periplasmic adaptor subunit [Salipiger mangrovisoli]